MRVLKCLRHKLWGITIRKAINTFLCVAHLLVIMPFDLCRVLPYLPDLPVLNSGTIIFEVIGQSRLNVARMPVGDPSLLKLG